MITNINFIVNHASIQLIVTYKMHSFSSIEAKTAFFLTEVPSLPKAMNSLGHSLALGLFTHRTM